MADLVSCNVDTRNLMGAIGVAREYSKRTPAIAVNTAAYLVAWRWYHLMPVASISSIDAKLSVPATLRLRSVKAGTRQGPTQQNNDLDAGDAIVLARMNPASNYSAMTGNYWPVRRPGSFGRAYGMENSRAMFIEYVKAIKERMKKARHSSTHYLQSCIVPAIRALKPFASKSAGGGGGDFSLDKISGKGVIPGSGWAIPARAGSTVATCEIANAAGMAGINSVLNLKHNNALWREGALPLQLAIDAEFAKTMTYVSEQEMKRDQREYESLGFKMS